MRGLVFDLDDTLYPRARYVIGGLAAVAGHLASSRGLASDDVFALLCRAHSVEPRRTLQAACSRYGLPDAVAAELIAVFRQHRPSLWLAHDATATLQQLRGDGWRLAVLTNGLPSVQARKIEALHIEQFVDAVVYAEDCAPGGKPHGAPFVTTLARLGLPANRCVMVGDDPACDVAGGRNAGLRTIWLDRRADSSGSAAGADARVRCLGDVPAAAAALLKEEVAHAA